MKKYTAELSNLLLRMPIKNTNSGQTKTSALPVIQTYKYAGPSALSPHSGPNDEALVARMRVNLHSQKHVFVSRSSSKISSLSKIIDISDLDAIHLWSSKFSETSHQNSTSKALEKFQHISVRG
jgi:hypothetical protein